MSETVIQASDVAKRYVISQQPRERYLTLRDAIANRFRRNGNGRSGDSEDFWALQGVDFKIQQGDRVGVIGRNGAGKSTLLKILSRITEPTRGRIVLRGRVASLLEVGTGFHMELTGRENIYLNGAILGMSRNDIRRKFDQIVEFSEVERFLDTPVKRYSSGMYMRLAFAVAAHLEPEILLVDEVLAVGDAAFQKKCLGKMGEVTREGRTILFVSHNMGAVSELCNRGILLEKGRILVDGKVEEAVLEYGRLNSRAGSLVNFDASDVLPAAVRSLRLIDSRDRETSVFDLADPVQIVVRYEVRQRVQGLQLSVILTKNMIDVITSFDTDALSELADRMPGVYEARLTLPAMFLKAGVYSVYVDIGALDQNFQQFPACISFEIEEVTVNAHSRSFRSDRKGVVVSQGKWATTKVAELTLS